MTLTELDAYFNAFLRKEEFAQDVSLNGIQVQNSAPDSRQIDKIAFAVDACLQTILQAAEQGAQMLFVHHGLFWGACETVTGTHYERIAALLRNDIALYASHIPLDANHEVGNNYGLAARLGLCDLQACGVWRGMTFGVRGEFPEPLSAADIASRLFPHGERAARILAFGKSLSRSALVLSGGTGSDIDQAAACGADVFVCGELGHEQYHYAKEHGINVIAGGHYNTETVGVQLVAKKIAEERRIQTVFIDVPTGL